jgi:imidazolonepropionase-like amidohydrolase
MEDNNSMNISNLPFLAGTASAYGLTKEEALSMITINPSRILGIENRVGTIEVGKDATIIVSEGDLLDMMSNKVELAFIEGRKIDLDNKHKRLYQKFKAKYD